MADEEQQKPNHLLSIETTSERNTVAPESQESSINDYENAARTSVTTLHEQGLLAAQQLAEQAGTEVDPVVAEELLSLEEQARHAEKELISELQAPEIDRGEISQEAIDAYSEYHPGGPKVGEVTVIRREDGLPITLEVRVERKDNKSLKYKLYGKNYAYTILKQIEEPDKLPEESYHANDPMRYYGDNPKDTRPYLYVKTMESGRNWDIKGVGHSMHQLAVERSLQLGYEGRVQLFVGGTGDNMGYQEPIATSAGFHESFGFIAKDVYKEDGSLHHTGQSVHENMAERRVKRAKWYKETHNKPPQQDIHDEWEFKGTEELIYMYLPEEIIARERKRASEHPILTANAATTEALLEKHEKLENQYHARRKAEKLESSLNEISDPEPRRTWEMIAEKYQGAGNEQKASAYFNKVADSHAKHEHSYGDLRDAVKNYARAHNYSKLKEVATKAAIMAEGYSRYNEAIDFYTQAGNEDAARRLRENRDKTIGTTNVL